MHTSPCQARNDRQASHNNPRQILADEHLNEAEQIVQDLFPEAVSIVFTDAQPGGLPRIAHILGAHGVLLYSPGERDLINDLVQTHLADAIAPHTTRDSR